MQCLKIRILKDSMNFWKKYQNFIEILSHFYWNVIKIFCKKMLSTSIIAILPICQWEKRNNLKKWVKGVSNRYFIILRGLGVSKYEMIMKKILIYFLTMSINRLKLCDWKKEKKSRFRVFATRAKKGYRIGSIWTPGFYFSKWVFDLRLSHKKGIKIAF